MITGFGKIDGHLHNMKYSDLCVSEILLIGK